MRLVSFLGFAFGPLVALSTACADDTQGAATEEDYANIATSLGTTAAHQGDEVRTMRAAAALARGDVPAGLARGSDGAFAGATAGLSYRYALTCHPAPAASAAPGAMAAAVVPCDPATAGAEVNATWSGGFELPALAVSTTHTAAWRLTGITKSIAHVDGTGQLAYDTTDDASAFHYRYDATYHVVVDDQRAIGGAIALAITATHTGAAPRTFTIDAELTFAPDDTAELVLDGTRHYRIALATGAVTRTDDAAITAARATGPAADHT